MKEQFFKIWTKFFIKREFVFRFSSFDNSARTKQLNDTNVVEYELFNSGINSIIEVNNIQIFSPDLNRVPTALLMKVEYNEMDNTQYNYKFLPGGGAGATTHLLQVKEKIKAKFAKGAK